MTILMCDPTHYDVSYRINPWMNTKNRPVKKSAQQQWNTLKNTLESLGAKIKYITPQPKLPDLVFAANAGLLHKNKFIPSNFRYKERQGEKIHWCNWMENAGYEIIHLPNDYYFEGAGDAIVVNDYIVCGYGFRTDMTSYVEMCNILDVTPIMVELVNSKFYHLDTCFCSLDDHRAIYFPKAFKNNNFGNLTMYEVPVEEANRFACNSVVLGRDVVIPSNCPETCGIINDLGYETHEVDMDQYIKSGGACRCLTLLNC